MLILVMNCGSSSIKYDLFDMKKEVSLCKGLIERIGEGSSILTHHINGTAPYVKKVTCRDHREGAEMVGKILTDKTRGVISDVKEVAGVGHRVVHGGEEFSSATLINDKVIKSIEKFSELAPLHNPPALKGIKACMSIFRAIPQVAVFDTAFHYAMPECAFTYGIPYEFYEKYGIRKYGFHGTSHRFVSYKAAELLGRPLKDLNLITVHLGNGCSITAVSGGTSVDTSMGFTPLEGLVMGTRSGDIDPAVVFFLMEKEGYKAGDISNILNKKSGLLGLSGISNDMRDILAAIKKGNKRARLAYDVFVYRIRKYIGAYAAVLGKVDAVVFTAGIGENVPEIKNEIKRELRPILGSGTEFLTIGTDEDLLIAKDTYEVIGKKKEHGKESKERRMKCPK